MLKTLNLVTVVLMYDNSLFLENTYIGSKSPRYLCLYFKWFRKNLYINTE